MLSLATNVVPAGRTIPSIKFAVKNGILRHLKGSQGEGGGHPSGDGYREAVRWHQAQHPRRGRGHAHPRQGRDDAHPRGAEGLRVIP
jgi:hypothetical protein